MIIISGGNTGVDQAALHAARSLGLQTGGCAPKGWRTEAGPAPWLADYGLHEHTSEWDYEARTLANVRAADATLIIGRRSRGSNVTERLCQQEQKPYLWVFASTKASVARVRLWLVRTKPAVLLIAGNRESNAPGIGALAEEFLRGVLR